MLKDISEKELQSQLQGRERTLVFFYTPLCGTCKLARRMLEVVDATLTDVMIYTCDANFAPALIQSWQVQSVPALAYVDGDGDPEFQFAFANVEDLYGRIKSFISGN